MKFRSYQQFVEQMKPLRLLLALFAIIIAIFAAKAGTSASYEGLDAITTLVIPALTPLIFLVLLLDALMNRVWLIDATEESEQKYRNIIQVDLILAGIIFIRWIPYFISIWQ